MGFSAQTILIKFHLKQHISLIFVAFKTINVLISCSAAMVIQLETTTKSKSPSPSPYTILDLGLKY